jgi:predicted fused transcriptional regulator/phosphomethylpyrimidine kinase
MAKFTLELNNETHPTVEVVNINNDKETVDFINKDGLNFCPYTSVGNLPTEAELKTAIEAVLGEVS